MSIREKVKKMLDGQVMILGKPIETQFGQIRFYSYQEYINNIEHLTLISFSVLKFYYTYRTQLKEMGASQEELVELKKMQEIELFDFVMSNPEVLHAYLKVINDVVTPNEAYDFSQAELISRMDINDFYTLREIIMQMNLLKEEKMSPSPRVQDQLDKGKAFRMKDKEAPNTDTILSSIFVATGTPYHELSEMTAYQIISTYHRVHAFSDFMLSALFATVSADVKLLPWDSNSEIMKEEKQGMSSDEFDEKIGGLFK